MVNMPPPPPWFLPIEQQMHYWSYWMSIYPMHQHQFQPRFNCNFNRSIKSIFKVNNVQHFNLDPLINGGSVSQQVVQPTEVPKTNQVVEIVPNVEVDWENLDAQMTQLCEEPSQTEVQQVLYAFRSSNVS